MRNILSKICTLISDNTPAVLATIVRKEGSSPRTVGARMIVFPDGSIMDTIGGGQLEAKTIENALNVFSSGQSMVFNHDLSGEHAESADMICGGKITVLLELIENDKKTETFFLNLANHINEKTEFKYIS